MRSEPTLASLADTLGDRRPARLALTSHLAAALLLARVQERAIANRTADPAAPALVRQDEVDELLLQAAAVEGQLLAIEEAGVVHPTRFRRESQLTRSEFLRGVRAQPWHIAAGHPVPRPDAFGRLAASLVATGTALVVGPSGSGKSTLMWQYAYATSGRCVTLNSLAVDDVDRLGVFIDVMTPEGCAPLVLCADDIGTSRFAGWTELVKRYAGDKRLLIIGTCREEDFSTLLTGGGMARVVTPALSEHEAEAIGRQLPRPEGASERTPGDFKRLHDDARSLMMEFVHLATTNRHLDETLADQVAALENTGDETALGVLRLIAAADVAGAVLNRGDLRAVGATDSAISGALRRLQGEFLIVVDGDRVGSVHPLRSRYLLKALHEELPTVAETFATLIGVVDVRAVTDAAAAGFRAGRSGQEHLEQALVRRLERDVGLDSSALGALLRAEAAAFANVLHGTPFDHGKGTEMALLAKLVGRLAAVRLFIAPALPTALGSSLYQTALDGMNELDDELSAMPDPRPIRRNVIEALPSVVRRRILASALNDPAALSPLFGSDALDRDAATFVLELLQTDLEGSELGGAICRLARIGARSRAAVQDSLGGEEPALERVLDLLVPTFAVRAEGDQLGADVLVPPSEDSRTVEKRLSRIADLAYSVSSNRSLLALEAHDATGKAIELLPDRSPLIATGGAESEWLGHTVWSVHRREYVMVRAEVAWSRWLLTLAELAEASAANVEMVVSAFIGFSADARRRRSTRRWRDLVHNAVRSPPPALPPPPRLTDEDPDALRDLDTHLQQMAATRILLRNIVSDDVDEDVARTLQIFFDCSCEQIPAIREWLAMFCGESARPATERLFAAAHAAAWLGHSWLTDKNVLPRLIENVSPSPREPSRAVTSMMANARKLAEGVLRVEGAALQRAVDAGWELHEIDASYRGDALPISRWLLVWRDETGTLDFAEAEALVDPHSTPTLDGRLLVLGGLPDGPVSDPLLVWRLAGWQRAHPNDRGRARAVLPPTTAPGPVLARCQEVVALLEEASKRAAAARLRGRQQDCAAMLTRVPSMIADLPDSVQHPLRRLREKVDVDVATGSGPSLALDRDRHLIDPSYRSEFLDFIVAAQAAAVRDGDH